MNPEAVKPSPQNAGIRLGWTFKIRLGHFRVKDSDKMLMKPAKISSSTPSSSKMA